MSTLSNHKLLLLVWLMSSCIGVVHAQRLYFGVRHNDYLQAGFVHATGLTAGIELSAYNCALRRQTGRLSAGYCQSVGSWRSLALLSAATQFEGVYSQYALLVGTSYRGHWGDVGIELMPNYDSALKDQWDAEVALRLRLCDDIAAYAAAGNLPEYREDITYLRVGADFHHGSLWVLPTLSFAFTDWKDTRLLISMGYSFDITRRNKNKNQR